MIDKCESRKEASAKRRKRKITQRGRSVVVTDTLGDVIVDWQVAGAEGAGVAGFLQRWKLRTSVLHPERLGQARQALPQERFDHLFKNGLILREILARQLESALDVGRDHGEAIEGGVASGGLWRRTLPLVVDTTGFVAM